MGQAIRQLALENGWNVAAVIGERRAPAGPEISKRTLGNAEVAVEFTEPDAAVANIAASLRAGVPVVVGTTGWYEALPEVTRIAKESGRGTALVAELLARRQRSASSWRDTPGR